MKIALCLNVLNEEKNIGRILDAYHDWVDTILIVDGGSTDKTKEIALGYSKVHIETYPALSEVNGVWLNNITRHVERLVELANWQEADWIIYDDCDCVPNYLLKDDAKLILEFAENDGGYNALFATRLYVYGTDQHFVKMSKPFGEYVQSLWAWKTSFKLELKDSVRHLTITNLDKAEKFYILPPRCLLHYFAPDEETIQRKRAMQRQLVGHEVQHPLQFGGELEPLPEWARLER